jgi:hypothetical protein
VRESGLPTNPYFLFLSAKQARAFLRDGQPEFMIFVPEKLDPDARPRIDLEKITSVAHMEGSGMVTFGRTETGDKIWLF